MKKKSDKLNRLIIKSLVGWLTVILIIFGCSSTQKKSDGKKEGPLNGGYSYSRQEGPVNNPNYFGKRGGGQTQMIITSGRAQIMKSGDQTAFDAAMDHALRAAVEQVLGSMIDSRTRTENYELISDKIYNRSYGFVQRYELLEEKNEDNTKWVKIKAWVVLGDVRSDAMALGILQDRANRPLVLVLIKEENFDGDATEFATTKLHEILLEKQFEFVEATQLKKVLARRNKTVAKLLANRDEAFETALDLGAQVVIEGKVVATENDVSNNPLLKSRNLKSVQTSLVLKAFTAGDARLLVARSKSSPGVGLSDNAAFVNGVNKVAKQVADDFFDAFIAKWDDRVNNGFEYNVIIAGINFEDAVKIKTSLQRNVEGVLAVFDRGFTGKTQTLLVRYSGETSRLAQAMTLKSKIKLGGGEGLSLERYDSKSVILKK